MENLIVYTPFTLERREGTIDVEWLAPRSYDTRSLTFELICDNLIIDTTDIHEVRAGVYGYTLENCEKNKEYTITVNAYQRKDMTLLARGVTTGITMDPLNPPTNIFADQAGAGVVDIYMSSVQTSIDPVLRYRMQWKEVLFEGETFSEDTARTETSTAGRFTLTALDGIRIVALKARIEGTRYISPWSPMYWVTLLPDMSPIIAIPGPETGQITVKWRSVFPAGSSLKDAGYAIRWWRANESACVWPIFIDASDGTGRGSGGFEYIIGDLEVDRQLKVGIQVRYGRYARSESIVTVTPCARPPKPANIRIRKAEDKYELAWESEHLVEVSIAGGEPIPCFSNNLTVTLKDTVPYDISLTANTGIKSDPITLRYIGGTPCMLENVHIDGHRICWGDTDGDIYVHVKDHQKIIPSVKSTTMTLTAAGAARQLLLPDEIILEQTTLTVTPINDIGRGDHVQVIFKYGKRISN
jgi:hypothetical protein